MFMDEKARGTLEAAQERAEKVADGVIAPREASPEELRVAARQALDMAERELSAKPKLTGERKELILEALAVRKKQTRILDELGPDQKIKLQAMALEAFGLDSSKNSR